MYHVGMDNSGYHVMSDKDQLGPHVMNSELMSAEPLDYVPTGSWAYDACPYGTVPEAGRIDRYFYSAEDIEQLSETPLNEVKARLRTDKTRYRVDRTSKRREFYLYDLMSGMWVYMLSWVGTNIDDGLLAEARFPSTRPTP